MLINREFRNNKDIFVGSLMAKKKESEKNIFKKVNDIFASPHHVYKSKVEIEMKDGIINTVLVGKIDNYLLTLGGEKININDILDINRVPEKKNKLI